jgi:hypothetical protein
LCTTETGKSTTAKNTGVDYVIYDSLRLAVVAKTIYNGRKWVIVDEGDPIHMRPGPFLIYDCPMSWPSYLILIYDGQKLVVVDCIVKIKGDSCIFMIANILVKMWLFIHVKVV